MQMLVSCMSYVVIVAGVDELLDRSDVLAQEEEPLRLEADLVRVYVARRHVLVAVGQPWVLSFCGFGFVVSECRYYQ